jgi:alanine racemase
MWLTAVDPGRLLFGIKQPIDAPCPWGEFMPALRALRTRLIQVKAVSAGDPPEYGWQRVDGVRRYGILPFGWADGFLPGAYEQSGALVRGVPVRFLKALSTEHSIIDLTAVPDAQAGDRVTILGRDGERFIDVRAVAKAAGVLVSEVTRRFHRHLSIVYFRSNTPVRVKTLAGKFAAPFPSETCELSSGMARATH